MLERPTIYECAFRDDYDNVGGVVSDQAEADEDTSLRNRALMAVGKIKQSFETHTVILNHFQYLI